MFAQSLRIGKILGIPFGVNYSWFIIFVLITLSLSTHFAHEHPAWSDAEHLLFGVSTSLLFFGSILLHELGHSVMALRYGIPVQAITLFVFGGVAQIGKEPQKPYQEFNIAIAGPIVSGALGIFFYGVMLLAQGRSEGLEALGGWLSRINVLVAVFNLLPGFPLDGGRVLRAILWKSTGSFERATTLAAGSGQLLAYGFIMIGIWVALTGNFFGGLWIGFLGWFLLGAAQTSAMQVSIRTALAGITARDVMSEDCLQMPSGSSVADLVENYMLRTGSRCAMVVDDGRFRGLVTLHEVKQLPREEWDRTPLRSVMVPQERLRSVPPETSVESVLQIMGEQNVHQVPVVRAGQLLGVVGRDRLLSLVQTRLEFRA